MAALSRHHPHSLGAYPRRGGRGAKHQELRRVIAHGPAQPHAPVASLVPAAAAELAPLDPLTLDDADRPPGVFDIPLQPLAWSAPFQWLAAGWKDFVQAPMLGLFYGACFVAMGWLLMIVFQHAPAYTLALSAGFLLVGPMLCLGLYQASQSLDQGHTPRLGASLLAWRTRGGQMAVFGGVLLILEMLWGRSAMIVFALSFDAMPDFQGSLLKLVDPENAPFIIAYLSVGAVFAGLIYAISVISIPMMLDRQVDAVTAGLTSLRLVTSQPGVMLLWGALITALVCLAMVPGFFGLLLVGPLLGHASWHAYKAAVGGPT
ncbi:MAG: DUF2189 domain-containing protein [Burkholderiales bacterium]|nr:DUF2189 domain-containing protein [Burkholderiales bacterium]